MLLEQQTGEVVCSGFDVIYVTKRVWQSKHIGDGGLRQEVLLCVLRCAGSWLVILCMMQVCTYLGVPVLAEACTNVRVEGVGLRACLLWSNRSKSWGGLQLLG